MTAAHETNDMDGPHEGPIKTPKQLILAVLYAFVVPIFGIVLLVMFVTAEKRPAAGSDAMSPKAVAERIRPVGMVEVKDASDLLRSRPANRSSPASAAPAMPPAPSARPSSAMQAPGRRASRPGWTPWSIPRWPARARCRRRAAATSATTRSRAPSSS
jgi:hypothetical protein